MNVLLPLPLLLLTCTPPAPGPATPVCQPVAVGLDTSCANASVTAFLGRAVGQTFLARDTLISKVTVWRIAEQPRNGIGLKLFILRTDSLGAPDVYSVLLDGPTLINTSGDSIHAVRFDYVFDPPFALPAPGLYAFVIQGRPCDPSWNLEANVNDDYADGSYWSFGRSDCALRPFPQNHPEADMVFTVEFCSAPTPIKRSTWGELKTRYR